MLDIDTLYTDTLANGGATVNVRSGAYLEPGTVRTDAADAYAVGNGQHGIQVPAGSRPAFVDAVLAVLRNGTDHVGTWVDDGIVYIDPVDIIWDRETAVALGESRGEQAIFNLGTAETVDLSNRAA